MDAHEALAELVLQRLQRFLDQVLAARVVHDDVFFLGLQVMHVLDRDQAQAAAHARAQVRALARCARAATWPRPAAKVRTRSSAAASRSGRTGLTR